MAFGVFAGTLLPAERQHVFAPHVSPPQQDPTCPAPHGAPRAMHAVPEAQEPERQRRLLQSRPDVHGAFAPRTGTHAKPPSTARHPLVAPHEAQRLEPEPQESSLWPSTQTEGASGGQHATPVHAQAGASSGAAASRAGSRASPSLGPGAAPPVGSALAAGDVGSALEPPFGAPSRAASHATAPRRSAAASAATT